MQDKLYQTSKTICYIIVANNIMLVILVSAVTDAAPFLIQILAFFVVGFAGVQMVVTLLWAIFKYFFQEIFLWGIKRCCYARFGLQLPGRKLPRRPLAASICGGCCDT